MARHIYIGNEAAVAYTSGVLANGAIDVQKISVLSGPTSMVPSDVHANTNQFRIVQGDGTTNIVSPWIYGEDVIHWDGCSYAVPTAHQHTTTWGSTSTAAGVVSIKICRTDVPGFDCFSFDTDIPSGTAGTAVDALVQTAYAAATTPDWLATTCTAPGTSNVFSGLIAGGVADSGYVWVDTPPTFVVSVTDIPAGLTGTWTLDSAPTGGSFAGCGSGYAVRIREEEMWGNNFGVYDRAGIPKNPTTYSVLADTYDMYEIAATKDGSSQYQVHGVDNVMEVSIAFDNGTAALTSALEGLLNPYMASVGFANVNL